jgi:hypothetical protein
MPEPAPVPGLVLRLWVGAPESPGDLAALHAHPMLWPVAAGDPGGPRWDSGHSPDLGPLASLVITAAIGQDGIPAGWRAEYRDLRPAGTHRVNAMLGTLRSLRRHLKETAARHGPPSGFEEHLARTATALGVSDETPFAAYHPWPPGSRSRPEWHRYSTETLAGWLNHQVSHRQALVIRNRALEDGYYRDLRRNWLDEQTRRQDPPGPELE